jgi:hypothetical protein
MSQMQQCWIKGGDEQLKAQKPIIADLMLYSRDQSSSKIAEMSLAAAETRPMQ